MQIEKLKGKKILIVGYGREGLSVEKYLRVKIDNPDITVTDQNDGDDYLKFQNKFDIAIRSPGVRPDKITIPTTTATNLFFSAVVGNKTIIGVTGSKGKSTTASLISHILNHSGRKTKLVGNIGYPMLSALIDNDQNNDIYVCELSSYQLCDLKYSPDISVVTSIFPEHMTFHGGLENYYAAKLNIIKYSKPSNYYVYNQKFELLEQWTRQTHAVPVPFDAWPKITSSSVSLIGDHNLQNVRGAATVARLLDVSENDILQSLSSFKPLPHRLEYIGDYSGIKFYDDAISTTPESTIEAIKSLDNISVIFLGGQDRGYRFEQLAKVLAEKKISVIVLFPDSGQAILEALNKLKDLVYKPKIIRCVTMESAVKAAFENGVQGSVCLLSCASPSYSLWKNFEEKGDQFKYWVQKLSEK